MSSDQKNDNSVALTRPVVMSFPNLHEPRAVGIKGKEQGAPKYSANFVFPPDHPDLSALVAKAKAVAASKWPGRELVSLKFPFHKGDKRADEAKAKGKDGEFQRGKTVLTARSKYEPRLSVIEGNKLTELEGPARAASKNKFYNGVEVLAQFNFVSYESPAGDGVTAYLNQVCSLNKGARIAGGASAAEVFKGYSGHVTAEDPTGDDEIPY